MKRILAIIIALMIILTGCSKAKSNNQDVGSQVTDDKVIENASDTEEAQEGWNSNETASSSNSTDQENKKSKKIMMETMNIFLKI